MIYSDISCILHSEHWQEDLTERLTLTSCFCAVIGLFQFWGTVISTRLVFHFPPWRLSDPSLNVPGVGNEGLDAQ